MFTKIMQLICLFVIAQIVNAYVYNNDYKDDFDLDVEEEMDDDYENKLVDLQERQVEDCSDHILIPFNTVMFRAKLDGAKCNETKCKYRTCELKKSTVRIPVRLPSEVLGKIKSLMVPKFILPKSLWTAEEFVFNSKCECR